VSASADTLQAMGDAAHARVLARHEVNTEAAKLARHIETSVQACRT
jgi:hypothetical protein